MAETNLYYKERICGTNGKVMLESREAYLVMILMPLRMHHIFAWGHHYGPEPWCEIPGARPDWLPSYYHQADKTGLGFNRSRTGSNAVAQYPEFLAHLLNNPATCPEEFLLWFHHIPWNHTMKSGRTMWWNELCYHYNKGVNLSVYSAKNGDAMKPYIDKERHKQVAKKLDIQVHDAICGKMPAYFTSRHFQK